MVPVELFSIRTSADAASRCTKATPWGDFRLTPKLRFVRLDDANDGLVSALDFDHVSAVIGEDAATLDTDPSLPEVENPHSSKRAPGGRWRR
jgi:hypothetical protein